MPRTNYLVKPKHQIPAMAVQNGEIPSRLPIVLISVNSQKGKGPQLSDVGFYTSIEVSQDHIRRGSESIPAENLPV